MMLNIPASIVSAYICATVIFGGLIILFSLLWLCLRLWEDVAQTLMRHCKAWRDLNRAAKMLDREKEDKE